MGGVKDSVFRMHYQASRCVFLGRACLTWSYSTDDLCFYLCPEDAIPALLSGITLGDLMSGSWASRDHTRVVPLLHVLLEVHTTYLMDR